LVFPEGTRSLDGNLGPFERGGFLLALKSGLPIVPVGVIGGLAIRRRESYVIRPGRISLRYGGPLRVEDFGVRGKDELMERVRKEIVDLAEIDL
jgi:1-acyl-sn-glycerol-3-phosphate acyltransferase